ncbi:MAG: glycosyltransferase family 2 protein, partial [bacterium]|nr:glycosyltransferase family 2 protein [Candidatus Kapabacteria bacterium]
MGLRLCSRFRQLSGALRERVLERRRHAELSATGQRERRLLDEERARFTGRASSDSLVSITVATWNRAAIVAERTIPAVLAQTHRNFELIVVGDCCTDDTAERIARIDDRRVRFVNLEERGNYPAEPFKRHLVAGSIPMMAARNLAQGAWIAHLDDDEVWEPDHLEVLLRQADVSNAELVWGRARYEIAPGEWRTEGSAEFARFDIPHSTVLMRTYLKLFREDMECWKLELGADRHRFRRMYYAGVRASFVVAVVTLGPLRPDTTRQWVESEDREE